MFRELLRCFLLSRIKIHNIIRLKHFQTFLCFCSSLPSNSIAMKISICFASGRNICMKACFMVVRCRLTSAHKDLLGRNMYFPQSHVIAGSMCSCRVRLQPLRSESVYVCQILVISPCPGICLDKRTITSFQHQNGHAYSLLTKYKAHLILK